VVDGLTKELADRNAITTDEQSAAGAECLGKFVEARPGLSGPAALDLDRRKETPRPDDVVDLTTTLAPIVESA
jgi:hypothetical protein